MFDFQKLNVYTKARDFSQEVDKVIEGHEFKSDVVSQLSQAASQIMLDIARSTGQIQSTSRSQGFAAARQRVHECAAILDYLLNTEQFEQGIYDQLLEPLDALSRMLYALSKRAIDAPQKKETPVEA